MEFKNAVIVKKANIYFGGKVTSRVVHTETGEKITLGVMLAGDYEFPTEAAETMEMLGGSMAVMLPGETEFTTYTPGQSYDIPANSSYKIKVAEYVDYCCYYK